jgi:hypothetical protein
MYLFDMAGKGQGAYRFPIIFFLRHVGIGCDTSRDRVSEQGSSVLERY